MSIELHRRVKSNIGDYYCNPSRYFAINGVTTYNISPHLPNIENKKVIIGGGGLIHKQYGQVIQRIIHNNPKHLTLWGIGHNYGPSVLKKGIDFLFPDWLFDANLIGIRDWVNGYEQYYVPCVTCMHPAFSNKYKNSTHSHVFYLHERKTKDMSAFSGPIMHNGVDSIDDVIRFLSSGETIVTNSYHGAYWGLLLGKHVITSNWSTKFQYFKYPPTVLTSLENWSDHNGTQAPAHYLDECRSINQTFFEEYSRI